VTARAALLALPLGLEFGTEEMSAESMPKVKKIDDKRHQFTEHAMDDTREEALLVSISLSAHGVPSVIHIPTGVRMVLSAGDPGQPRFLSDGGSLNRNTSPGSKHRRYTTGVLLSGLLDTPSAATRR
jgi:hypothetical protein